MLGFQPLPVIWAEGLGWGGGTGVGGVLMGYPHIKDCLFCDCWPGEGRRGGAELKGAGCLGGGRSTLPRYFNRRAGLIPGHVFLILILVTLALSYGALFLGLGDLDAMAFPFL